MISSEHGHIRGAEPDDAPALHALYEIRFPRAALLDHRREPLLPTQDELREVLGREDLAKGIFHTIEDHTGAIVGFCTLRGMNHEAAFGELGLLFHREDTLDTPLSAQVLEFARDRAFRALRLHKVLTHCLDNEGALRAFLIRSGFVSAGVQREVLHSQGRRLDLESFYCLNPGGGSARWEPEAQVSAEQR